MKHVIKVINTLLFVTIVLILSLSIGKKLGQIRWSDEIEELTGTNMTDSYSVSETSDKGERTSDPIDVEKPTNDLNAKPTEKEVSGNPDLAEKPSDSAILALSSEQSGYYYLKLDQTKRQTYLEMLYAITNFRDVTLSTVNEADLQDTFQLLLLDHPEVFYSRNYSYVKYKLGAKVTSIVFQPSFTMTEDEAKSLTSEMEKELDAIVQGAPAVASDYEKVKYVTEYIVFSTTYDKSVEDANNPATLLLKHRGTCGGYSALTQLLLTRLGVQTTTVIGDATNREGTDAHAWNLVKVSGLYYHHDVTWCDMDFSEGDSDGYPLGDAMNYRYFLVTTKDILQNHTIDHKEYVPEVTATMDNYFVREGLYFTTFDPEVLAAAVQRQKDAGKSCVQFLCSDAEVYRQFYDHLLTESHIFDYVNDPTVSGHYMSEESENWILFWF
ncbi:MAG: hypothetical protein K6G07_03185 [Lachnospiraceae bacterium]|nr:hypothetical protein [Lachnospiraceae bacterium]